MDSGYEIADIAAQRVIDRINEQPELAIAVLTELREDPLYSLTKANQIEENYGTEGRAFHQFLGEVISNRELYLRIDIGNEAIDSAAEDPAIRQFANNLKINAYILTEEVKEKIARAKEQLALSTRANELLALAKLASLSQIQEQKNSQIRA